MKFNQIMEHVGRDISIAKAMNHESSALECHLPNLGTGKVFVCFSMVLCFPLTTFTNQNVASHIFLPRDIFHSTCSQSRKVPDTAS